MVANLYSSFSTDQDKHSDLLYFSCPLFYSESPWKIWNIAQHPIQYETLDSMIKGTWK